MAEEINNNTPEISQQELSEQNRIRLEKLQALQAEGKNPYAITTYDVTDHSAQIVRDFTDETEKTVSIAGRMMSRRVMGKASFAHLLDREGRIQVYVRRDDVGEEAYKLGDIWNGVTNTALREEFRSCNAYARKECDDCWARLYCSGGCAANAYHATGSIRGVYEAGCELFKKRIECAIMMKVAESQGEN